MHKIQVLSLLVFLLSVGCSTSKKITSEAPLPEATLTEERFLDTMFVTASIPDEIKAAEDYQLPSYQSTYSLKNDLIHTKLDLKFDWTKQQVNGKAELTLKPYFYSTDEVAIDAKGFDIHKITLSNGKH